MTSRALLFGTALALALGSSALAQPAKREVGNIVFDGAPARARAKTVPSSSVRDMVGFPNSRREASAPVRPRQRKTADRRSGFCGCARSGKAAA